MSTYLLKGLGGMVLSIKEVLTDLNCGEMMGALASHLGLHHVENSSIKPANHSQ